MPKEATIILLDNSEYNRNGDFPPSRWESQLDAAKELSNAKFSQNGESAVGIMVMAGSRPDLKLTPTRDDIAVSSTLAHMEISKLREINQILTTLEGYAKLFAALKIGQLALKHR